MDSSFKPADVLKGLIFSLCDVSGQRGVDLRSWPSCVVPFVCVEVVLSPQCTNLYIPGYIEQHIVYNR